MDKPQTRVGGSHAHLVVRQKSIATPAVSGHGFSTWLVSCSMPQHLEGLATLALRAFRAYCVAHISSNVAIERRLNISPDIAVAREVHGYIFGRLPGQEDGPIRRRIQKLPLYCRHFTYDFGRFQQVRDECVRRRICEHRVFVLRYQMEMWQLLQLDMPFCFPAVARAWA